MIVDCYMVASGVPERSLDHARNTLEFAIEMLEYLNDYNSQHGTSLKLRIGINSGPVTAGVIGVKKISFDLWGGNT